MAVDVEASIHASHLDIGIFGSHRNVSGEEAQKMVLRISNLLNKTTM